MTLREATHVVPGYPTRGWRLHVPMAPDDPAGPSPAVAPAPAPSAEPKPAEPAPTPAAKPEAKAPAAAKPAAKFKVTETGALGEKITGLSTEVSRLSGEIKERDFLAAFSAAKIDPKYHGYARTTLGEIDPKSDAGKKAVDDFAKAHTAMLTPEAKQADPVSAWIDTTLAKDEKRTSLASIMPRSELERTLANLVK